MAIERIQQLTMSDGAVRALRDAILDGTLTPGSQLREAHLAADLGISRAPVREALHRLEEEGLVVRTAFRGAFVAQVSPQTVAEIEALRAVLEPYAVECAMPHLATTEGRSELAGAVKLLRDRSAKGDRPGSIEAHLAVHRALYRASGNQILLETWESWDSQLRLFLALDHQSFPQLGDISEPHERLLELIEAGDMRQIRKELHGHIHPTLPDQPAPRGTKAAAASAPSRGTSVKTPNASANGRTRKAAGHVS